MYQAEVASKLGHLDVLQSDNVNQLIDEFESLELDDMNSGDISGWQVVEHKPSPFKLIYCVDGSIAPVVSLGLIKKELAFVKTALFVLDESSLDHIDKKYPHPLQMKKMMKDSAHLHATVFPLKNIRLKGTSLYDSVRKVVFDSFKDPSQDGLIYETYKWLIYKKWEQNKKSLSPSFQCPHLDCRLEINGMPYDSDKINCPHCNQEVLSTDLIGLHMEMNEFAAAESLATSYMLIHETIMLFSSIRYYWESDKTKPEGKKQLSEILFIKDGPLSLRSQYSKLVPNIREFLKFAVDEKNPIYLIGQEKTGVFDDFFQTIERNIEPKEPAQKFSSYKPLTHKYIREAVQCAPFRENEYGLKTNYGEKVLVKIDSKTAVVINVPPYEYKTSADENYINFPSTEDFIELEKIVTGLHSLVTVKYKNALLPIVLANGVASLSSYPSASVLKLFAFDKMK
ncbi:hypothetical protein [Wohlfahrtiimonas chitiniclastica]|uniref:hypothetical protein n=1 Tax=Wohlfahrtiimonas chitiniclastica TaxID=400946 RepID=UPI002157C329|nr:hypothetical protein [Wohlfahrtiimonas chitiniclastica]MDC7252999.1 hypothetical protein [Wohlfahrtiimonas chitiniclastica]